MFGYLIALSLATSEPAPRQEHVELVGVSEREGVALFNVRVKAPRGNGVTDAYEVSRLVATGTGEVVATFKRGHGSSHPEWQSAAPASELAPIARRLKRKPRRLSAEDGIVRLEIDRDAQLDVRIDQEGFTLSGASGSAVGFVPVARLFDGRYVPLAHLRVRGVPGRQVLATLRVFHTASAETVIMIASFSAEHDGQHKRHDVVRLARLESPLATTRLGALRSADLREGEVAQLFGALHPEGAAQYRQFAHR